MDSLVSCFSLVMVSKTLHHFTTAGDVLAPSIKHGASCTGVKSAIIFRPNVRALSSRLPPLFLWADNLIARSLYQLFPGRVRCPSICYVECHFDLGCRLNANDHLHDRSTKPVSVHIPRSLDTQTRDLPVRSSFLTTVTYLGR